MLEQTFYSIFCGFDIIIVINFFHYSTLHTELDRVTLERYDAGARAVRSDQSYPESPTGSGLLECKVYNFEGKTEVLDRFNFNILSSGKRYSLFWESPIHWPLYVI